MDSHHSTTAMDSSSVNQDSSQNQSAMMMTNSEGGENFGHSAAISLQIGTILEKIFSFLDVSTIKKVRSVNTLWSTTGAKVVISKCFVLIPPSLRLQDTPKRKKELNKFMAFLSCNSNSNQDSLNIPKITVGAARDGEIWKFFGVGPQVTSLKLNFVGDRPEWLHKLLNSLPNLKYVSFEDLIIIDEKRFISKFLNSVVSWVDNDQNVKPLVVSSITLRPDTPQEVKIIEKFSEFASNIRIEELDFCMQPNYYWHHFSNFPDRVLKVISKLLETSQNTFKRLSLFDCEIYLSFLDFPLVTDLNYLFLHFNGERHPLPNRYGFAPTFQFSEKLPNLEEIGIGYGGILQESALEVGEDFFANLFENTGAALSVKKLRYFDSFLYNFEIDPLFQTFPNAEELRTSHYNCSQKLFHSLWTCGNNLKKLYISIDLNWLNKNVANLDSFFTGFDIKTVEEIGRLPSLSLETFPSILDVEELHVLTFELRGSGFRGLSKKRLLAVAGEYAFKLMPSGTRIIIHVRDCRPTRKYVMAALDEVSKLPNVVIT